MKYIAIIDSGDKELSENAIKELKNSTFYGDDETPYFFEMTSIKEAPEEEPVLIPCEYRENDYAEGYNQALRDCGVIENDN